MVCLGNICRSPIAEGILRHKARTKGLNLFIDSAGTSDWHRGQPPDERAITVSLSYGVDISSLRSRPFTEKDWDEFDLIFAMDSSNLSEMRRVMKSGDYFYKADLILNQSKPGLNQSVPDPYIGGTEGFHTVFKMLDEACDELIKKIELGEL